MHLKKPSSKAFKFTQGQFVKKVTDKKVITDQVE